MRNWTHHYARINGIQMHYVEEGQGPLVLLLHGFPHTWFSWRHQITALAEAGYRVVAPDLRGMGQTEAPEELAAYRADVITADLVGLLDHLGRNKRWSPASTTACSPPTTWPPNTPNACAR